VRYREFVDNLFNFEPTNVHDRPKRSSKFVISRISGSDPSTNQSKSQTLAAPQ